MRWGLAPSLLVVVLVLALACGTADEGDAANRVDADRPEPGDVALDPASSEGDSSGDEVSRSTRSMPAPVLSVEADVIQMEMPAPGPEPVPDVDLAEVRAAVERNPSDYAAQRELAIALFRANMRDLAVVHFERAAELNSGVRAQIDLANAYGFASRLEDAEATYRRVLEMSPDHVTTLYNLGNAVFMRGDMKSAIEFYDRAIAIEPDYLLAHYHRGLALKMEKRFKDAYTAFGAVMNLDPANDEEIRKYYGALYEMAALDIAMGALPRAEQMLQALLEANPEHPNAHYLYGQLLLRQGRVDEAQKQLEVHMKVSSDVKPTGPVATAR